MRKDDHLIFEAFSNTQNSINNNSENAEDMSKWDRGNYIVDLQGNIIGEFLGNSNISELKLGNDVKHLNSGYAQTINWGTHIGLWSRNKRHRLVLRNPDKWNEFFSGLKEENAEDKGMSSAEYHQARKFGLETGGEEVGKGPIKIQLTKDQALLCTRDGREQEVKFARGVIFNCDEWVGDYYHCESDKYGGIAVFPPDIKLLNAPKGAVTHLTDENAEDMSKSPFHYDAMKDLAPIANKIYNTLRSAGNDEARPEHIEKMAEIILGPQSAYASVDHYEKALSGVIELLNHYVNVPMNEGVHPDEKKYGEMMKAHQDAEYKFRDWLNKQRAQGKARNYPQKTPYEVKPHWRKKEENAEMPTKQFMSLKQFINKGPVQVKKPSKELPSTHKEIHPLVKQDSREGHRDEEAESACIEDLANKHGVSLEDITHQLEMGLRVEMEHTEDMNIAKKIALDHLAEDPHYYTKLSKMEGKSEQEERRLDPKCWKGYHKQGTKLKGGKRVNNCVKNS